MLASSTTEIGIKIRKKTTGKLLKIIISNLPTGQAPCEDKKVHLLSFLKAFARTAWSIPRYKFYWTLEVIW